MTPQKQKRTKDDVTLEKEQAQHTSDVSEKDVEIEVNIKPEKEEEQKTGARVYRYQVFASKPGTLSVDGKTINIHAGHNVIHLSTNDTELEEMLNDNGMKLVAKLFS